VEEILSILQQERVFIDRSGGGVTFSGGEPMLQLHFLREALEACKSGGFHTAVDTSGHFTTGKLKKIIPYTDLFLFDIKHLDSDQHKKLTGVPNDTILKNFRYLVESKCDIRVRIPIIPGFNDQDDHLKRLRDFIITNRTEKIKMINLLPYHSTGVSKYKKFNRLYKMETVFQPSAQRMEELKHLFSSSGIRVKIGG
jgi:pyruvate formate lyase activating enzyme